MSIVIKILAAIGAVCIGVFLIVLFTILESKFHTWFDGEKIRKKRILRSKHKEKIPVYCCECKFWAGKKQENGIYCPFKGNCTCEFDYCSRGEKHD